MLQPKEPYITVTQAVRYRWASEEERHIGEMEVEVARCSVEVCGSHHGP
jgi:hypothetical protein